MRASYINQGGRVVKLNVTKDYALARVAYLDAIEERGRQVAPTDSGRVGFDYRSEADALRSALRAAGYDI